MTVNTLKFTEPSCTIKVYCLQLYYPKNRTFSDIKVQLLSYAMIFVWACNFSNDFFKTYIQTILLGRPQQATRKLAIFDDRFG